MRELPKQTLHRIGGKLYNKSRTEELSAGEEHLWDAVCSELEYRNRRITPADRFMCLLCCDPFASLQQTEHDDQGDSSAGPF